MGDLKCAQELGEGIIGRFKRVELSPHRLQLLIEFIGILGNSAMFLFGLLTKGNYSLDTFKDCIRRY